MSLKRFLRMMVTNPNSSNGLILRAEKLEEDGRKENNENYILYAKVLRELASKNLPVHENRKWIRENLRGSPGGARG